MTIKVFEGRRLNKNSIEQLVVHLEFGESGIADASRLSIEDDVERLFRQWLSSMLSPSARFSKNLAGDIKAFRSAQSLFISGWSVENFQLGVDHIAVIPSLFLVDFESNSPSFKKTLRACVMSVVLPITTAMAATSLSQRLDPPKPQPASCIVVPTTATLQQFVSGLGTIQQSIDRSGHAPETYRTLVSLYAQLAEQPNAKLTISVVLNGEVTSSFEVTSDQARHDLPMLVEKVLNGRQRR
jgi:hypothetical protein